MCLINKNVVACKFQSLRAALVKDRRTKPCEKQLTSFMYSDTFANLACPRITNTRSLAESSLELFIKIPFLLTRGKNSRPEEPPPTPSQLHRFAWTFLAPLSMTNDDVLIPASTFIITNTLLVRVGPIPVAARNACYPPVLYAPRR